MITNGKIVNAWLYVSITGLTASGNVLGKVSETDAHCSRNPSHEGGPGLRSIPGQRDKEIEFARLGGIEGHYPWSGQCRRWPETHQIC